MKQKGLIRVGEIQCRAGNSVARRQRLSACVLG